MMVFPVGDAILSAIISHLVTKLASPDLYSFLSKSKILSDIKKWKVTLLKINAVLEDAEEKQLSDRSVEIWLRQLRDLAYDVEDILDELAYDALHEKRQQRTSSPSKVMPRLLSVFNPRRLLFNKEMDSKIKDITARLQEIVQQKNNLELRESGSGGGVLKSRSLKRLPSTSLVDEFYVCGRDGDKKHILGLLFTEKGCDEYGVGVIPIVGMGGVGKTTLAQLVYNDKEVMDFFELRVWCCVSEDFDVVRITRTILDAVGSGSCDVKDLNLLQVRLRDKMMGKRFLIVLDDVWNENYDDWTVLRRPFQMTSPGSKIIVTTRNQGVASMMSASPGYPLKELSFDDSLSLFAKHAFGRAKFNDHPDLQAISGEIVQRCKGLPLAVKTLGGLLRSKSCLGEWESILNSKIWDLSEQQSGVLPALRLSYCHLPSHLKQLFVFCAILPKDYEFYKEELVFLWMAEGFLPQTGGKKQIEGLDSCFNDLLSRSFFQRSGGEELLFRMHNLISDLAQSIAGETCVHLNDKLEHGKHFPVLEKTRHMSFIRHTYEVLQRFKGLGKMKHLRTFIALRLYSSSWSACCYLCNNVLHESLPRLVQLRVLSLSGYCIIELPKSIGGLKQLRYLNLSQSKIKQLPESVSSLLNLQTLKLYQCRELNKLPQGTGNLISLCHLDITDTDKLLEMPSRMGNLKGLLKLSKFIVGKNDGNGIEELKQLKNLQGRFSIQGLQNVKDARHAIDANLRDKQRLVELELEWSQSHIHNDQNLERDMQILNSLQPHTNIQVLKISSYGGEKFPSWVGHPSFTKIVHLKLSNCSKCTVLPALGRLPLLEDLCIQGLELVKNVGHEFYGDGSLGKHFPSLKTLKFEDMLKWEFWSSSAGVVEEAEEEFPSLCNLTLVNCPKLRGKLPSCLPSCGNLTISKCPLLVDSLVKLPSLHEMKLEECSEMALHLMADISSLTALKLRSISELARLEDEFIWSWKTLKVLTISNCSNLMCLWEKGVELEILACPQFVSSTEYSMFSTPKDSQFSICGKQEHLPIWRLPIEELCFESCPKLVSIPEVELLLSLRHLVLRDCKALMSLPVGMNKCPLEDLEIEECPLLTCFPGSMLPTTLKGLKVRYCSKLQSLPDGMMHKDNNDDKMHCFEHLEIIGCPSLTSFPAGKLPTRLKTLKIWDCSQLVPLSESMLHDDTSLQYIGIADCSTLTSFPELPDCFKHLTELFISNCSDLKFLPEGNLALPSLRRLSIFNCARLKSMPNQMRKLASLQELTICDCPALVSFPNGDLPPNLTSLEIWDCDALDTPMSDWNLQSLAFLRDFSIAGGCFSGAVSFPDEKCLLPTTLSSVWIGKLPNLESLSVRIQNLTSLEELEIVDCPKLQSLPCEVLPPSLGRFSIRGCPGLEKRYFKKNAVHSPLLAKIPFLEIMDGDVT